MNTTEQATTITTETFGRWVRTQTVRAQWMDDFLRTQLGGDESRSVRVTRLVTPFGTFTRNIEAA